jgi:hypothetical protein
MGLAMSGEINRSHKALRPRRRPRPRIWPRGVMECGSVGVLRQVRIAPRVRGVGDAFLLVFCFTSQHHPDLKT